MAYTQVGSLVSFTAGTTIVSADVNQNFADIRTVVNALVTGTDTVQAARINPVSGAGVSVNAAALDYSLMRVGGSFTSGGASTVARSVLVGTTLTAANGDTGSHAQVGVAGSITTQGNSETVGVVATVHVAEPDITVGSGDTVTNAAAVYIEGGPTEGTNNYALFVDAGVSRLDGGLIVGTGFAQGYRQARVVGAFTSDGSSSFANAMSVETALTGANGDTDRLTLLEVGTGGSSITTQGNSETVADVVAALFDEPDITVGAGDTVTNASTVKINSAPTEGTNNYALWVDAGDTRLDGGLLMTGTVGVDVNPGSDADADLITVGVTGGPKLSWDESEDAFLSSNAIHIPAGSAAAPGLAFSSATTSGLFYGTNQVQLVQGGVAGVYLGSSGTALAVTAEMNVQGTSLSSVTTDLEGNVRVGGGTLNTTDTEGHVFIPDSAGAMTGVPAGAPASGNSGGTAIVYDKTNKKIGVYDGGWIWTAALS